MPNQLKAADGYVFESGKTYTHAQGLSCCFRQWRAAHSHCRFLHGYALQVEITFQAWKLDDRNWVMDFGGLKPIKAWLEETFDHKTLVAKDDPHLDVFKALAVNPNTDDPDNMVYENVADPILQLNIVDHVGCEAFAKMIFEHTSDWLLSTMLPPEQDSPPVWVESVTIREHGGNHATYRRCY
jgi:6-pyruvoyltetrahydropterin/6-carboxytetrahydropterin synthase